MAQIMLMITTSRKAFQAKITGQRRWGARHCIGLWTGASSETCVSASNTGPSSGNKGTIRIDVVDMAFPPGGTADVFRIIFHGPNGSLKSNGSARMRLCGNRQQDPQEARA